MQVLRSTLRVVVFAAAAMAASAQTREELGEFAKLKILYAGESGSDRESAFVEFLTPLFASVGTVAIKDLDQEAASEYDVVVADWKRRYPHDAQTNFPSAPGRLDEGFVKPVVLVGAVAGEITRDLKPKLDWL